MMTGKFTKSFSIAAFALILTSAPLVSESQAGFGGLAGALDAVTKKIDQAGKGQASSTNTKTGATTTSVANPDGSHTVTKKDKTGKVVSRETVGKSPAFASSTDNATGITTTSVRNRDGTRTVTRTDKTGKVLSRETRGKSPASASSTNNVTGITTTSVRNPDGSHKVTTTGK